MIEYLMNFGNNILDVINGPKRVRLKKINAESKNNIKLCLFICIDESLDSFLPVEQKFDTY